MNNIGWAVKQLWDYNKVRRAGWNNKGMWLGLFKPSVDAHVMTIPYVYISTAQGDLVPWVCSQSDLLAIDWELAK